MNSAKGTYDQFVKQMVDAKNLFNSLALEIDNLKVIN